MRQVIVKDYITEALFRLLEEKKYSEITINELVKKAGVCRASFYRNYLTKDQIIDEYLQDVFQQIYSKYPLSAQHMREGVCCIFHALIEEKARLILLEKQGLLSNIQEYLYESTIKEILKFDVLNNRYQPHYFAGATSAMISAWIGYGMEETETDMADIFIKSLSGYMKVEE